MKFMKLGSKDDAFQTGAGNTRYVKSELASDAVVTVAGGKFYLHKFPLLSKSARLQKLVTTPNSEDGDEINVSDIPGGPAAFEICAKFCYGMTVTLSAYNVVAALCAAKYLGMQEDIEKGNLVYKIEVFLSSSIFHSWKDSIIVLQTTQTLLPFSEELNVVSNCIDTIATKACVDVGKVDWSYTYNRKKVPEVNGIVEVGTNGSRHRSVPKDWWVEDLCELEIDLYKHVLMKIKIKSILPDEVIGEAVKAYAYRRLPGFSKGIIQCADLKQYQSTVATLVLLLPAERGSVSCSFLLKLLKAAIVVNLEDATMEQLVRRIGQQLEEASVHDLLIQAKEDERMVYDVETVKKIVEEFLIRNQYIEVESPEEGYEVQEARRPGILAAASKLMVAKLIDGYLAEIARDPKLPMMKFVELAEMVSGISRPVHDKLYRAIDTYLKEHPTISKSERKNICRLMDCKKLSVDASKHAVQNERLPLRVVVQVLFFEQVRLAATSGSSTPDLPKSIRDLNNGSYRSSKSAATNPEEDWEATASAEELKALKTEIASLRLANSDRHIRDGNVGADKSSNVARGLLKSKILSKLWLRKGEKGDNSGSDSSESLASPAPEEAAKSTPFRNRRISVS